jgi:hypothetical protein
MHLIFGAADYLFRNRLLNHFFRHTSDSKKYDNDQIFFFEKKKQKNRRMQLCRQELNSDERMKNQ